MEQTAGPAAGTSCRSWGWQLPPLQTLFCPSKCPVWVFGVGESGTGRLSPAARAQGQPSFTQSPLDLRHQHLSPQFIKKQLIPAPPTPQVLRFLSLPADCRAVIRVWLMRFSWGGYGLSPYLPTRQRLCHRLWGRHKFFLAVFTAIQARLGPGHPPSRPGHGIYREAPERSHRIASTPSFLSFFFPHPPLPTFHQN